MGLGSFLKKAASIAAPVAAIAGHPEIGAAIGAGGALLGGDSGKTSASQTQTTSPAAWSSQDKALWDEFISMWTGQPHLTRYTSVPGWFDPVWYLKQRPDVARAYNITNVENPNELGAQKAYEHYIKYGKKEGMAPNEYAAKGETPPATSVRQLVKTDTEAKQAASEKYLNTLEQLVKEAQRQLSKAYYKATTPNVKVSLGSFSTPIVSRSQRQIAQDIAKYGLGIVDQAKELAAKRLAEEVEFTPATSMLKYLSMLQPLALQLNALRYRTPTVTETGSMETPEVPLLSQLAGMLSVVNEAKRLGETWGGNKQNQGNWLFNSYQY